LIVSDPKNKLNKEFTLIKTVMNFGEYIPKFKYPAITNPVIIITRTKNRIDRSLPAFFTV